jgi:DNA-binding transcriptional ArsR family regulator
MARAVGRSRRIAEMSRFGVMKHLRVLERAHLVIARRSGREKLHYLNAVPIRRIHDRWLSKYAEPITEAMIGLKDMLEAGSPPAMEKKS